MEQERLEKIYRTSCCDILPSSEDFKRMNKIGVIQTDGDVITIYEDPEPEEDQCQYRCLREKSRLLDLHMTRMTELTRERKKIEREGRELNQRIWNRQRAMRVQKKNRQAGEDA